ncbi:MAG: WecB/TagA/CpsF family glycosyltransferase [Patescibacteria group bacterium]|jgi:N-acetylglucosaminyldiphosphoundecaprenol N-acetyl-beta-D-mannosaminyltransferase
MDKLKILGVNIDNTTKQAVLEKISDFLKVDNKKSSYIVTPNPEIILEAQKDEELFYILNQADLSLPDGIGVKFAGWLSGVNFKRISGADITADILALAEKAGRRIGVLIWNGGWSHKKEVEKALKEKYPNLNFVVEEIGREENISLKTNFLEFNPEIIFVGLGFPWQEKFIYHQLKNIPSAKIALGIGGTFDYLTGRKKRAPHFIRTIGLEWLWRLVTQPKNVGPSRVSRIRNAVVVFTAKFIKNKFINRFFYRPNIACLLYKKESVDNKTFQYKILLAERKGWPGHWQLPQGGIDGENPMAAGERELREELNTKKFVAKRIFPNIFRYEFPKLKTIPDENSRRYSGYKGQRQSLFIAEFTGNNEDIKVNFWDHSAWKWVETEQLIASVHPIRKRTTQRFLKKFKEFIKQK